MILLKQGSTYNVPTCEYYIESEDELKSIPTSAPTSSTVLILTDAGLSVKMKNSKGEWVSI